MKHYFILCISVCFYLVIKDISCDRTSLKIYENIQSDLFCFRRLNATHQIGCASHRNGNVGVLYLIEKEDDINETVSDAPPMPYIVAMPFTLFNMKNMKKLKQTENIRGVFILKPEGIIDNLKSFSPDQSCPNRNYGFYTETMNKEYAACKKKEWNKLSDNEAMGMMFEDWGMPIFIITNETHIDNIKKCHRDFNNDTKSWPLCSAQMTSVMLAAKDSDTCMRRNKLIANLNEVKTCDPLSDKNIVNTLFPTNKSEEISNKSIIVVGARLDSFSMFDKVAPGAHSTVTGLVTLLAVAKNMASLKEKIIETVGEKVDKNVLFIIFNGEAFDYIGSSRIVFDMQNDKFPLRLFNGIQDQPAPINLHHLSHFIELSQLAPELPPTLWLHTDPVSIKLNSSVSDEVQRLINLITTESKRVADISVSEAPSELPLPPASFQSFLRKDDSIAGVVIADHDEEFINKYYNSILDSNETLDTSQLAPVLSKIATVISGTLYTLVTGKQLEKPVDTSEDLVSGLLECYLQNASCPLFRQIADPLMTERLRVEPYPLYVSVDSGGATKANAITLYTRYLLAYLTGSEELDRDRKNCTGDSQDQIYHFDWMAGNGSGICVKSTVMYTMAQSPAFVLNDWKSSEYSTWTESVWLETSARIFVQPGKAQELATLVSGFIIFFISIGTVYFFNERSSIIFNTKPLVGC